MKAVKLKKVNNAMVSCKSEYVSRYPYEISWASGVLSFIPCVSSDHTANQLLAKTCTAARKVNVRKNRQVVVVVVVVVVAVAVVVVVVDVLLLMLL